MPTMTDLDSHHIEGFAAAALRSGRDDAAAYFRVPLISHIEGNLWMGGCEDDVILEDDFVHVVSLYPWERYAIGGHTSRAEFLMYDSAEIAPATRLNAIADYVSACMDEGKTLVHCQAGLNRSGLISALTLIRWGYSPEDAITLLRAKRHDLVLCNETFEAWLLTQAA